jgi:hypothetical protein
LHLIYDANDHSLEQNGAVHQSYYLYDSSHAVDVGDVKDDVKCVHYGQLISDGVSDPNDANDDVSLPHDDAN